MTKKKVWIIVCASVVAAAIIGIVIFLIVTRSVKPTAQDSAPESIDGTYCVMAYSADIINTQTVYTPNQEMVFEDGNFSYYQNGTAVATAKYAFNPGAKDYTSTMSVPYYRCSLEMTEASTTAIPSTFVVKYYTENIIELVDETAGKSWHLAHLDGTRDQHSEVTAEYLCDTWAVVLKGNQATDITMQFTADKLLHVTQSSGNMDLSYTFDETNKTIEIDGFGLIYCIKPCENQLVFAQVPATDSQGVTLWELKRA